jgi:hypothetical protein
MNIDVSQKITTLDGTTIPASDGVSGELRPTVLKDILVKAMIEPSQGEAQTMKGEVKFQRYMLAQKIYQSEGVVDFEIEDLALLRESVGKLFGPLVVGQVWSMLEGK